MLLGKVWITALALTLLRGGNHRYSCWAGVTIPFSAHNKFAISDELYYSQIRFQIEAISNQIFKLFPQDTYPFRTLLNALRLVDRLEGQLTRPQGLDLQGNEDEIESYLAHMSLELAELYQLFREDMFDRPQRYYWMLYKITPKLLRKHQIQRRWLKKTRQMRRKQKAQDRFEEFWVNETFLLEADQQVWDIFDRTLQLSLSLQKALLMTSRDQLIEHLKQLEQELIDLRYHIESTLFKMLPDIWRETLLGLWDGMGRDLRYHVLATDNIQLLQSRLFEFNRSWNLFHRNVKAGVVGYPLSIQQRALMIHYQWNRVLKTLNHARRFRKI